MPTGRPSSVKPHGSDAAGCDVMLNGNASVQPVLRSEIWPAISSGPSVNVWIPGGDTAIVGTDEEVVRREDLTDLLVVRAADRGVPELGRHRLAEHDPARPPRALDDDRVRVGDVARVDPRAVRSLHAGRGRQVLEGDRDTVQRPDGLARDERGLGGPRVRTGLACGDDAERVDARVQRIDPREERVHDLDGRDLALADERRRVLSRPSGRGPGRSSPSATSRGTRGSGASRSPSPCGS